MEQFSRDYIDVEIRSNLSEINNFMKSNVWRDLKAILAEKVEIELERLTKLDELDKIKYSQGVVHTLKDVIEIPQTMLEVIEQEEKEEREEENAES